MRLLCEVFQSSRIAGLRNLITPKPSTEVLGYYQSSASRTTNLSSLRGQVVNVGHAAHSRKVYCLLTTVYCLLRNHIPLGVVQRDLAEGSHLVFHLGIVADDHHRRAIGVEVLSRSLLDIGKR